MLQLLTVPLIEAWACHAACSVGQNHATACSGIAVDQQPSVICIRACRRCAKGYASNQVTLIGMTQIALWQSKICNNYNNIEHNPNPTLIPIHTVHRTAAVYIMRS